MRDNENFMHVCEHIILAAVKKKHVCGKCRYGNYTNPTENPTLQVQSQNHRLALTYPFNLTMKEWRRCESSFTL